jgi:hypothetical protein
MAVRKAPETTKHDQDGVSQDVPVTVTINKNALMGLVFDGPVGRVEMVYRAFRSSKSFLSVAQGPSEDVQYVEGLPTTYPNHLDVERWTASLCKGHPELKFARTLYSLAGARLPASLKQRILEQED